LVVPPFKKFFSSVLQEVVLHIAIDNYFRSLQVSTFSSEMLSGFSSPIRRRFSSLWLIADRASAVDFLSSFEVDNQEKAILARASAASAMERPDVSIIIGSLHIIGASRLQTSKIPLVYSILSGLKQRRPKTFRLQSVEDRVRNKLKLWLDFCLLIIKSLYATGKGQWCSAGLP
jgi:hypothetical protein